MALGRKTGGQRPGSLNKKNREVSEICEQYGYNPIQAMIRIAYNPKAPLDLRAKMHAEIAPYLYSKRTNADAAPGGTTFQVVMTDAGRKEFAPPVVPALPAAEAEQTNRNQT
jgi:hypothetical protein